MSTTEYRLTRLPKNTLPNGCGSAILFLVLMACPFIGFAIHGKVEVTGLETGLKLTVIPLVGLAIMAIRSWFAWRKLPPELMAELKSGKVVPADDAPYVEPPVRFSYKKHFIEVKSNGLTISRSAFLRIQGVSWSKAIEAVKSKDDIHIAWPDVVEWGVTSDSDGPDYYALKLHECEMRIRRFRPVQGTESDILDAIRSIGRIPIRLHCSVEAD